MGGMWANEGHKKRDARRIQRKERPAAMTGWQSLINPSLRLHFMLAQTCFECYCILPTNIAADICSGNIMEEIATKSKGISWHFLQYQTPSDIITVAVTLSAWQKHLRFIAAVRNGFSFQCWWIEAISASSRQFNKKKVKNLLEWVFFDCWPVRRLLFGGLFGGLLAACVKRSLNNMTVGCFLLCITYALEHWGREKQLVVKGSLTTNCVLAQRQKIKWRKQRKSNDCWINPEHSIKMGFSTLTFSAERDSERTYPLWDVLIHWQKSTELLDLMKQFQIWQIEEWYHSPAKMEGRCLTVDSIIFIS